MTEAGTEARPKTETERPAGPPRSSFAPSRRRWTPARSSAPRAGRALHAADQADLLEQLGHDERAALVAELKPKLDPELLTHLDETVREEVLEQLTPEEAGAAIAQLETDDAIEVLGDLDETEQIAILQTLPMPERAAVEQGLAYPEDSAGRLMQRELVAAPEFWTVGQTIDYLRAKPDLPDEFYDIYIVNPRFEPVGSIPLSKVVRSKRGVLLTELKLKELHLIPFDMDQEEVGFVFRQYGLVSAPVVDANRRLLGVTRRRRRARHRGGGGGGPAQPRRRARGRHLRTAMQTSMHRVPGCCQPRHRDAGRWWSPSSRPTIAQLVLLAVLMPVVASLGGNAGIQALTVTVRALAMRRSPAPMPARCWQGAVRRQPERLDAAVAGSSWCWPGSARSDSPGVRRRYHIDIVVARWSA